MKLALLNISNLPTPITYDSIINSKLNWRLRLQTFEVPVIDELVIFIFWFSAVWYLLFSYDSLRLLFYYCTDNKYMILHVTWLLCLVQKGWLQWCNYTVFGGRGMLESHPCVVAFILMPFVAWIVLSSQTHCYWRFDVVVVNWLKSVQANCGPMADSNISGTPHPAKNPFIFIKIDNAHV